MCYAKVITGLSLSSLPYLWLLPSFTLHFIKAGLLVIHLTEHARWSLCLCTCCSSCSSCSSFWFTQATTVILWHLPSWVRPQPLVPFPFLLPPHFIVIICLYLCHLLFCEWALWGPVSPWTGTVSTVTCWKEYLIAVLWTIGNRFKSQLSFY